MIKSYYVYKISVTAYNRVRAEKRDAQNQLLGERYGLLRYRDELDKIIGILQVVLHNQIRDSKQARILGETLFQILFDDSLCQDFVSFYHQALHQENHFLRVELDIDEQQMPDVSALPWEFLCLPTNIHSGEIWLATDPKLVFSRRYLQDHASLPIQLIPGEKVRIALAIAAPNDLGPVEFDGVWTHLQDLADKQSEYIELLPIVNPASPTAIDDLLSQQPHIFHFIGHGRLQNEQGEAVGEIALVKQIFNTARWVNASFFSELFKRHRPGIVLLQACESGMQSDAQAFVSIASKVVKENVPVVVGMQYKISNIAASQFAYEFYRQLGQDRPVDVAVQNSRRRLALETQYLTRDFATPVIFMRSEDGHLFKRKDIADAETEKQKPNTPQYANNIAAFTAKGDISIENVNM